MSFYSTLVASDHLPRMPRSAEAMLRTLREQLGTRSKTQPYGTWLCDLLRARRLDGRRGCMLGGDARERCTSVAVATMRVCAMRPEQIRHARDGLGEK